MSKPMVLSRKRIAMEDWTFDFESGVISETVSGVSSVFGEMSDVYSVTFPASCGPAGTWCIKWDDGRHEHKTPAEMGFTGKP